MTARERLEAGVGFHLSEPLYDDWVNLLPDDKDKDILWHHYGFTEDRHHTFVDTASVFDMPEDVVQARITEALRYLRVLAYVRGNNVIMAEGYTPYEGTRTWRDFDYDPWEPHEMVRDRQRTVFVMGESA